MISLEHITEYQKAHKEIHGEDITLDEAEYLLKKLVDFFKLVLSHEPPSPTETTTHIKDRTAKQNKR
jgi:hypothetical protein